MRRLRVINLIFFAVGVAGLAILIVHTGWNTIRGGLAEVGAAFILVCLAHAGAIFSDSVMLWACSGRRARVRDAFVASLAGHGINEATPLAKLGEITKFSLLSEKIPGETAAAALIVQNFTMFVAACAVISIGSVVTVATFPLVGALELALLAAAGLFAVAALLAVIILRVGIGSWPLRLLARFGVNRARLDRWSETWATVEANWQSARADRAAMAINWIAAAVSRGFEIAQAAIILHMLGSDSVLAAALMSVGSYQLILWTTSFIPMQMGSHEAASYALFGAVGLTASAGLLLELVRKIRRVVFVGVGAAVLGVSAFRSFAGGKKEPAP